MKNKVQLANALLDSILNSQKTDEELKERIADYNGLLDRTPLLRSRMRLKYE